MVVDFGGPPTLGENQSFFLDFWHSFEKKL